MQIALVGYGKMGKEIEKIAINRGHTISIKFNSENPLQAEKLANCDVAIEFSSPALAIPNIEKCIAAKCPVVVGTTGWYSELDYITNITNENNATVFYASNFSIGVNILFAVNKFLAQKMKDYNEYALGIREIHHTQKADSPSGTAITLAEGILQNNPHFTSWYLSENLEYHKNNNIPIEALRIENVPGTHTITYMSEIDTISVSHVAHNRSGFAMGAVLAAEYVYKKTGIFTMSDLLQI